MRMCISYGTKGVRYCESKADGMGSFRQGLHLEGHPGFAGAGSDPFAWMQLR